MRDEMNAPLLLDKEDIVDDVLATSHSSTVAILGSGDFSRSLAMRLVACGFGVVVGSRCVRRISPGLFLDAVELNSQEAAVAKAKRLVFMALFPEHYPSLLSLRTALAGKILVDVSNAVELNSNSQSNAEKLAEMFPNSVVVKGFNTISAWTLQTGAQDGNRQVLLCSDDAEAKSEVAQLARRMGFYPVDAGSLCCAQHLERKPLHLFPSWRGPVLTTFLLFFFFYGYAFIREILLPYLANGQNFFYHLVFDLVNISLSCVALVSLSLVYLPGLFAAWLQLWRGTKYQRFPCWLDAWLLRRKQLGLLSFLFAALHGVYVLCLPLRTITQHNLINTAYSQSGLGYVALTLTVMHALVIGWNFAFSSKAYRFCMPPIYMLAVALPCAVLVCRCFLLLPCVSARLGRIRRGWESIQKCPVPQHKRVQENRTIPQV
ncbi:Metalloreductase STEAP3 [Bagarius yarrelli]|uniref:Metalloreductase STEAP3 n=1 Tax=Bagarius yarrelli TaxID=175774 RepID=A0A556TW49_BAGYA|nr:Metalloreductase STEAP3 [Bagarius yarrelli]